MWVGQNSDVCIAMTMIMMNYDDGSVALMLTWLGRINSYQRVVNQTKSFTSNVQMDDVLNFLGANHTD